MFDTIAAIFSMIVPMTVIIVGGAFLLWGIIGGICGTIENSIEKQKKEKQKIYEARQKADEAERLRIEKEENNQIQKYKDLIAVVEKQKAALDEREEAVNAREENISHLEYINKDVVLAYDHLQEIKQQLSTSLTPIFGASTIYRLTDAMSTPRFTRGMDGRFTFATDEKIVAKIQSGDTEYQTSLTGCSCPATERPCKHMLWFAAHLGILQMNRTKQDYVLAKIYNEQMRANRMLQDAKHAADKVDKRERRLDDKEKILKEKQLGYPWMTRILCQYDAQIDDLRLQKLKATNARLAQEQISAIKKEKQAILKESLILRNQQMVYEQLFPWFKIVREANITPDDAVRISAYINEDEDYITFLRKILTVEEYTTLSPAEKFMCAVEHCRKNKPPEK